MDQRNEQALEHGAGFLPWQTTDEICPTGVEKRCQACQCGRRQPYIGVDKNQQRLHGVGREDRTGVLFPTPSRGQRRCWHQVHPRIPSGDVAHDLGGGVCRVVVKHDHFERNILAA